MVIEIWVRNLSIRSHNIVRIRGEHEGHLNNFRTAIIDGKYNLPIILNPGDPGRIIVFQGEFFQNDPDPKSKCSIIIRVFSRWNGKEIEAGSSKISLEVSSAANPSEHGGKQNDDRTLEPLRSDNEERVGAL